VLAVLVVAGAVAVAYLWHTSRTDPLSAEPTSDTTEQEGHIGGLMAGLIGRQGTGLVVIGAATVLAVLAAVGLLSDTTQLTFQVSAFELSILGLALLAGPAWLVLRARDARRFAIGVVAAAGLFLLIWYPNLTGLPLPNGLATAFQGLLPTWNYDFQFGINEDPPVPGGFLDLASAVVAVVTMVLAGVVMLLARGWRSSHPHPLLEDLR
jgi:hypothetical protein